MQRGEEGRVNRWTGVVGVVELGSYSLSHAGVLRTTTPSYDFSLSPLPHVPSSPPLRMMGMARSDPFGPIWKGT